MRVAREHLQAILALTIELVWKEKLLSHCRRDIVSVGKTLKQLRFMEKRIITMRLASVVRQFVEENDDRSSPPWKFGEEELSSVLSI